MSKSPPTSTALPEETKPANTSTCIKKKKKSGRKPGSKLELLGLRSGGRGNRFIAHDIEKWTFNDVNSSKIKDDSSSVSSSSSFFSINSTDSILDDDESVLTYDEMEDECVRDMRGNRILRVDNFRKNFQEDVCCKKCAIAGHTKYMKDFLAFTRRYEEKVKKDEGKILFHSKADHLQWLLDKTKTTTELYSMFCGSRKNVSIEDCICKQFSVQEETYGLATSIYGVCGRKKDSHVFRINADKISGNIRSGFHKNSRHNLFAINYRLCAAIQQMGCGFTDASTLAGFLDLPVTWDTMNYCMRKVEAVMGPIQLAKREECEIEALEEEIEAHHDYNDLLYHSCNIDGHKHPPLPMIKGTYGK